MGEKINGSGPTVWYHSRVVASQKMKFWEARKNAAKAIGVGESTLYSVEKGDRQPLPDEVSGMARIYCMPELGPLYCHDYCPLGHDVPKVQSTNLDQICVRFYNASKNVLEARDTLMTVAKDGLDSFGALRKLEEVISDCQGVNQSLQDMKVLVGRRRLEGN